MTSSDDNIYVGDGLYLTSPTRIQTALVRHGITQPPQADPCVPSDIDPDDPTYNIVDYSIEFSPPISSEPTVQAPISKQNNTMQKFLTNLKYNCTTPCIIITCLVVLVSALVAGLIVAVYGPKGNPTIAQPTERPMITTNPKHQTDQVFISNTEVRNQTEYPLISSSKDFTTTKEQQAHCGRHTGSFIKGDYAGLPSCSVFPRSSGSANLQDCWDTCLQYPTGHMAWKIGDCQCIPLTSVHECVQGNDFEYYDADPSSCQSGSSYSYVDANQTCEDNKLVTPTSQKDCFGALGKLKWKNMDLKIANSPNANQCKNHGAKSWPPCCQDGITVFWNNCPGKTPQPSSKNDQICIVPET